MQEYIIRLFIILGAITESSPIYGYTDNNDSSSTGDQVNRIHFIYLSNIYYVDDTHESFTWQIRFHAARNGTGKEHQLDCKTEHFKTDF